MPRIEVFIQVVDDAGASQARSSFQIENDVFQLLEANSPLSMVGELGELFRDTLLRRHPTLGSLTPGDLPVTTSTGEPPRDTLQRRLTSFIRQPANQATLDAIRQELNRVLAEYPDHTPILPEVTYSEAENRVMLGFNPEVSMGVGAYVAAASRTEEDFEGMYQAPAPPVESNPISRRIRQALRQAVGADNPAYQDYANRLVARETFLRSAGLDNVENQEDPADFQTQDRPLGRIRGRTSLGVMLDDSAYFGEELPILQGDTHPSQEQPNRHTDMIRSFQGIYGGDQYHQHSPRSAGIEPSFQTKVTRVRVPKTPENKTPIPTRYHRKPVI